MRQDLLADDQSESSTVGGLNILVVGSDAHAGSPFCDKIDVWLGYFEISVETSPIAISFAQNEYS